MLFQTQAENGAERLLWIPASHFSVCSVMLPCWRSSFPDASINYFLFFPRISSFPLIALGVSFSFRDFSSGRNVSLSLSFLDSAFIVGVLGELSISVLRLFRSSLPRWTPLVIPSMLALTYAAIWQFVKCLDALAWSAPFIAYTMCLDLSSSGLQIIYFIALAGLSRIAGIGWQNRELQIAAGLGFFSFVNFWATMTQLNLGTVHAALLHRYHLMDELKSFVWCCLVLYWIVTFARKERDWEPSRFRKDL